MTTRKTIVLMTWAFVGKVISVLFNMLSRLVTTFLPRSKRLLISWLQSPSTVILEPRKIKSATVSIVSTSICHEVMDQMPWSSFSECWALRQLFALLFHFHQEAFKFFFTFCHKGGVICVSEGIDISPSILAPACASLLVAVVLNSFWAYLCLLPQLNKHKFLQLFKWVFWYLPQTKNNSEWHALKINDCLFSIIKEISVIWNPHLS